MAVSCGAGEVREVEDVLVGLWLWVILVGGGAQEAICQRPGRLADGVAEAGLYTFGDGGKEAGTAVGGGARAADEVEALQRFL